MPAPKHFALVVAVSLIGLYGCDKSQPESAESSADEAQTSGASAESDDMPETASDEADDEDASFQVTSSAFEDGSTIAEKFTCDGPNISPPLTWEAAPEGTKSFAVIVEKPDAPKGTFYHWGLYALSADTTSLPSGVEAGGKESVGAEHAKNSFSEAGYGGPCPPKGDDAHEYRFRVLALDTVGLSFMGTPTVSELLDGATGNTLGEAVITATYKRNE